MKRIVLLLAVAITVSSCGIYSFSGTSIQPDVHSIEIDYFEYKALKVNPSLSNDLTEAIRTRFRRMTKLEQKESDADLELRGEIVSYEVSSTAITAAEVAAKNRLTVGVSIEFINNKYPEDNVSQKFSAFADFDATNSLEAVQNDLCVEIIDKLVEDIFNATVAQW